MFRSKIFTTWFIAALSTNLLRVVAFRICAYEQYTASEPGSGLVELNSTIHDLCVLTNQSADPRQMVRCTVAFGIHFAMPFRKHTLQPKCGRETLGHCHSELISVFMQMKRLLAVHATDPQRGDSRRVANQILIHATDRCRHVRREVVQHRQTQSVDSSRYDSVHGCTISDPKAIGT